jgi:DNA replication protein DnaC
MVSSSQQSDRIRRRKRTASGQRNKRERRATGTPSFADAICDRLVHNAHVLALRGGSMRKKKGMGGATTLTDSQS